MADHPLSPKSVVRDMYERAMTFADFVQHYELARTEGIVLRYLAGAYKALDHTVPDDAKTEDLQDLIAWLGELVRQVDSSLLDEWEQLANPDEPVPADGEIEAAPPAVTANPRAFRVLVRNALFRRVELAALAGSGTSSASWTRPTAGTRRPGPRRWTAYFDEYDDAAHRRRRPRPGAAG